MHDRLRLTQAKMPDEAQLELLAPWYTQNTSESRTQDFFDAIPKYPFAVTTGIPPGDWVSTIGEFLLDKISEADFLASANSPDGGKDQGQRCEAWYYAGMKRLLAGDKKTAADYFSKCLATQQTDLYEYVFAQTELKMLATAN